jgi:flagellin-like hook-associated protein FlgL
MIKGLDSNSARFLANLDLLQQRQDRVQRSISSGRRVGRSSDAPERVIDILQLRSDISRTEAIGVNLDRVKSEVDTAEAAIRVAVRIVERARVLAAHAASDTAENRPGTAIEARELHEQLVNLTFTSSEGRLVFSGDLDQSHLYEIDWAQPAGVNRLTTANNTREISDVNGSRFLAGRTAHDIFDVRDGLGNVTDENAFNALYALTNALEADDRAGVEAAAALLDKSLQRLGRETTFYGHVQNRVVDAVTLNKTNLIARQKELGLAQDTDIAEALVELNLTGVHHEAALGAQAREPRTSLFDFLA